ncbi:MAG: hypothetical protein FJ358_00075 [Thaumarchaeota archaeon]|nr:hypothetical protein [Nitrososphaerota archaeon]
MRMKISDVVSVAKDFIIKQTGHSFVSISSVDADDKNERWTVIADVGVVLPEKKEVIVDDKDGIFLPIEAQELVRRYLETRDHYFTNAQELISKGELRKASEMLWGAVTQSIKAFAALRNRDISKHDQFFNFMQQLSRELKDRSFYDLFIELNTLHRNFYDEFIPAEAFPLFFKKAKEFIEKIQVTMQKTYGT